MLLLNLDEPSAIVMDNASYHSMKTDKCPNSNYHSDIDEENFTKWVEEILLPNLGESSAKVIDNASYHSMKTDKCPNSNYHSEMDGENFTKWLEEML